MSLYTLFKSFNFGTKDYIPNHNSNYAIIEAALNELATNITGIVGGQTTVPLGLMEIFDRRGLIGIGSYDFTEATLTGPNYNLTIQPGAYYNAGSFYHKPTTTLLTFAGRSTGTYYINLDASGSPIIGTAPDATTTRSLTWNSTTHVIAAKTVYTGVNTLFDGDDYAACLASIARAKNFTKLATRLEEMEQLLARTVQELTSADTININWSLGGHARITLDRASTTINMSGAFDGQKCVVELIQDNNGNRAVVLGTGIQVGADLLTPVPLSTTGNKRDLLGFVYSDDNSKCNYVSLSRGF